MQKVREVEYGSYTLDANFNILSVDKEFCRITGYTKEEALKMSHLDLIPEEDRTEYLKKVISLITTRDEAFVEHRFKLKDGTIAYVFCLGYHNYDSDKNFINSTIRFTRIDKTLSHRFYQNEYNENLTSAIEQAETDDLTGLYRRDAYRDRITQKLLDGDQVGLFLIDVDNFKNINDTYGHQIGDDVLKFISSSFKTIMTDEDLGCRFGGDEFSVALFNRTNEELEEAAIKLLETVKSFYLEDEGKLKGIGISIGISSGMTKEFSFEYVYQLVDEALYEAKSNGKACYILKDVNDYAKIKK